MRKRCMKCISMVVLFSFIISLFPVGAFAWNEGAVFAPPSGLISDFNNTKDEYIGGIDSYTQHSGSGNEPSTNRGYGRLFLDVNSYSIDSRYYAPQKDSIYYLRDNIYIGENTFRKSGFSTFGKYGVVEPGTCDLRNVSFRSNSVNTGYGTFAWNYFTTLILPNNFSGDAIEAFAYSYNLENIIFPNIKDIGIFEISYGMFKNCPALKEIVIPEGVTSIGSSAFQDCRSLIKIVVPKSVTSFGSKNPFENIAGAVYVYENSVAKSYCIANSVPYIVIEEIPPQAVSLSPKTDQTISVGDTLQFAASVRPSNATDKTVLWDSSDSSVGTITQDGLFTAIKEGETYVSVTTNTGSKYAEVCVTVEKAVPKEVESISVNSDYNLVYALDQSFVDKGTIMVKYTDGSLENVPIVSSMVSGFSTRSKGTHKATISYLGKSITFEYLVGTYNGGATLYSREIFALNEPYSDDIQLNLTDLNQIGVKLNVKFNDVNNFKFNVVGDPIIGSVNAFDRIIQFSYIVKEVDNISVINQDSDVNLGDSISSQARILINFVDGTSTSRMFKEYPQCVSGWDTSTPGNRTLNINFSGKTCQFNYTVHDPNEKVIKSVELINPKDSFYQTEEFPTDLKAKVTYEDNSSEEVIITKEMVTGFDTSTNGDKTATITYSGVTLEYKYSVISVQSFNVTDYRKIYRVNDPFFEQGTLHVLYTDGSKEDIPLVYEMVEDTPQYTGFDSSKPATAKGLAVRYGGKTSNITLCILPSDEIVSIEPYNTKQTYLLNEEFDEVGYVRMHANGNTISVMDEAIKSYMISGFDTSSFGTKIASISFLGKTCSLSYEVIDELESISVKGTTADYNINDLFDNKGTITAQFKHGSSKDVPLTEDMLSGFDTTTCGEKEITVTYLGKTCTFKITVTKVLDRIEVSGTKLEYEVNEKFTAQGSLTLHYKDGSRDTIDLEESMVSNFDTSTPGSFTATVTYDGKTTTFEYNVISNVKLDSISVEDVTTSYTIGAPFDGRGKIIVHYTDGSTKEAVLLESNLTGFNTSVAGTRLVTVSYEGLTTQFEIEVVKQVDRITVSDMETEYAINSEFVKQGNVTVYYKDGSQDTISLDESMVSNFDTSTSGKHTVTVTYAGKTTTYKINVGESTPVSITANWDGKKTIQVDATGKFSHITLPNGNSFYKPSFIWPVLSSGVYDFTIHGQDGTSVDSDMVVVSDWDITPPVISFNSTYKTGDPVTVTVIDSESGFDRCIAPDGTEYTTSTFAYTPGMYGTFVAYDKAGNMAAKDFNVLDVQIGGSSSTTYVALDGIPNAWTNQDVVLKVGALNDEEGVISIEANGSNIDNSEVEFSPNEDVIASDEEPVDENIDSPVSDKESNESEEEINVPNNETENKDDIEDEVDKDLTGSDIESKPESDMGSEPESDMGSGEEVVEPDQNTAEEEIVPDNNTEESVLTAISTITRYLVDGPMLLDAISKSPVVNTLTVVDNGPISFTVITPSGEYEDSVVVERIDKVAPELTLTLRENNVLSVVATDDLSGLKYIDIEGINSYNFNTDGTLISGFDVFVPANGTITVAATDYAGNITTQTVDITYDTSNPPEEPNITPVDPSNPPNGDESGNSGNGDSGDTPGEDDENGGTTPDDGNDNDDITPPDDGSNDDVTPPDNDSSDDNNGNNGSSSGGGGGTSSNTGTSPDNVNKGESASDIGGIDKDNKPYVLHAGIKINGTVGKGYISGYEDRTFRPTNNLTRQEFASIIDRIITFETEANEPPTPFTDIQGCWGEGSINHLAQHNLIAGVEGNKFEPNRNITRAEAVVILSRIVDFSEYPSTSKLQGLSEWQQKSMIVQALNAGLVSNYDEETYDVNKNITRAEVVNIINNIVFSNKLSNKRNIFTDISDRDSWYEDVVKATDEKMLEMYK